MKSRILFHLLALAAFPVLISGNISNVTSNLAGLAIRGVVAEHFSKPGFRSPELFDFREKSGNSDLVANIFKNERVLMKRIVHKVDFRENEEVKVPPAPVITIFDSWHQFASNFAKIKWYPHRTDQFHRLIYIKDAKPQDLKSIPDSAGFNFDLVSFLLHSSESTLELFISYMFSPGACKSLRFESINKFDLETLKWEKSNFFPLKNRNFHGCPMNIQYNDDDIPGFVKEILKDLNFQFVPITQEIIGNPNSEDSKIFIPYIELHASSSKFNLPHGYFFIGSASNVLVSPGELYTPLEKMALPFDDETWIWIIVTFVTALIVIQMINRCSLAAQNFIFGRGIKSPTLNVADIFFNGGQNRQPTRNMARFLLMMFIIWSLIFRTCYQSKIFELLQADPRRPHAASFDDLREMNISLSHNSCEHIEAQFKEMDLPEFPCIKWTDTIEELVHATVEPSNKIFTVGAYRVARSYILRRYLRGLPSLNAIEPPYVTFHKGFFFEPNSPIMEVVNNYTLRLYDTGIMQKIFFDYFDQYSRNEEEIGPQVLTMDHLEMAFIVCMSPLLASFVAFLGELAVFRSRAAPNR